jgi:zinc protease
MFVTCFHVESADEAWGHTGMAYFLEHLMFKGTPNNYPTGTFDKLMKKCGVVIGERISYDFTYFWVYLSKENLETYMKVFVDYLAHLSITPEEFEKEQHFILQEFRDRTTQDDDMLQSCAFEILFANHPYQREIIGVESEVQKTSLEEIHQFRKTHYVPKAMTIVVVGDISSEEARIIAEKYYGPLNGPDPLPRQWPQILPRQGEKVRLTKESDQVKLSGLVFYFRIPRFARRSSKGGCHGIVCKMISERKDELSLPAAC